MAVDRRRDAALVALLVSALAGFVLVEVEGKKGQTAERSATGARGLRGRRAAGDEANITWNGCACKPRWDYEGFGSCNTSCCNPDNDTKGPWCLVADTGCEGADWGFCRPTNATIGRCSDSPPHWQDSEGDSCGAYGAGHWCTPDRQQGSGWSRDWGAVADFAAGGADAFSACCNCGGGNSIDHRCVDVAGWLDTDGDGCDVYGDSGWCNATGHAGVGWHTEWGTFANFSRDNKSAVDACCVCGGGAASTEPLAAGADQRYTWAGCACKKAWGNCTTYCCAASAKEELRCEVQDPLCEEADAGICRPLDWAPSREDTCNDEPLSWTDEDGYSCGDYEELSFCTGDGKAGAAWKAEWGAVGDALTVCCACGGGKKAGVKPSHYAGCYDDPGWQDKEGEDCQVYADSRYCTPDGKPGQGWHDSWGRFESHSDKKTAPQACCACGGGRRRVPEQAPASAPTSTPAPVPQKRYTWNGCECKVSWTAKGGHGSCAASCCNPDGDTFGSWCEVQDTSCEGADWGYCRAPEAQEEFATCRNSPVGWKDSEADTCAMYSAGEWCTKQRTVGPKWNKEWGNIEDYKSGGKTALEACCECGGGVAKNATSSTCADAEHWKDGDGDGCAEYQDYDWCTQTGGFGVGWHKEWGVFSGSPTAAEACCFCGGGSSRAGGLKGATLEVKTEGPAIAGAMRPAVSGAIFMLLLILIMTGVGVGWYCYRVKATNKDAEGLGAGVGTKVAVGRKYQTMDEAEL